MPVSEFQCSCGAAGIDHNELVDHIVDNDPDQHWPVQTAHVTERMRARAAQADEQAALRQQLTNATGMSIDQIKDALR